MRGPAFGYKQMTELFAMRLNFLHRNKDLLTRSERENVNTALLHWKKLRLRATVSLAVWNQLDQCYRKLRGKLNKGEISGKEKAAKSKKSSVQETQDLIASIVCKANKGKKRVAIGQAREFVKDLIRFDVEARKQSKPSPLLFLMNRSEQIYGEEFQEVRLEVEAAIKKGVTKITELRETVKKLDARAAKVRRGSK